MKIFVDSQLLVDCPIFMLASCSAVWTFSGLNTFSHPIRVEASDYAGNVGSATVNVNVRGGGGGGPYRFPD